MAPKKRRTRSPRARARDRGAYWEGQVAKRLGGRVWHGQDGDVEARGYRIEVKHRTDLVLETTDTLRVWREQVRRYQQKNPDKKFAFALCGGKPQGGEIWISVPIEEFIRLTDAEADAKLIRELAERYPEHSELIEHTIWAMAKHIASEGSQRLPDGSQTLPDEGEHDEG